MLFSSPVSGYDVVADWFFKCFFFCLGSAEMITICQTVKGKQQACESQVSANNS